jgi:multidrug efflux pump subunit AcrA (membrane-fusion protein)
VRSKIRNGSKIRLFVTVLFSIIALSAFTNLVSTKKANSTLFTAETGNIDITIKSTGELLAESYTDVPGPELPANKIRGNYHGSSIPAYPLKITDLVPEGTIVKKGDYVAQLDRTEYENYLLGEIEEVRDFKNTYDVIVLDSAVVLTNLRDEIKNQALTVEEALLNLEKSKYEAPAIIRLAEKRLERANMYLEQRKRSYQLRQIWKGREVAYHRLNYESMLYKIQNIEKYISGFTIYAPSDGMVVYKKNRNGTRRTIGTILNNYDMTVAIIPDLSSIISRTYISEIEISRVKPGQKVKIKVDAIPDKIYNGSVRSIGMIGENLRGSDTKMFEVITTIEGYDPRFKPGMTTGNEIVTDSYENVIHIPADCIYTTPGNKQFIYMKGRKKRYITTGKSDAKEIIVTSGLLPGEKLYLLPPENAGNFKFTE